MIDLSNKDNAHKVLIGLGILTLILLMVLVARFGRKSEEYEDVEIADIMFSRMSDAEFKKRLAQPKCNMSTQGYCKSFCNNGSAFEQKQGLQNVLNTCGSQFPVLKACPSNCTLQKSATYLGGTHQNKIYPEISRGYIPTISQNLGNTWVPPGSGEYTFPKNTSKLVNNMFNWN
jgi:hypothetical protein